MFEGFSQDGDYEPLLYWILTNKKNLTELSFDAKVDEPCHVRIVTLDQSFAARLGAWSNRPMRDVNRVEQNVRRFFEGRARA